TETFLTLRRQDSRSGYLENRALRSAKSEGSVFLNLFRLSPLHSSKWNNLSLDCRRTDIHPHKQNSIRHWSWFMACGAELGVGKAGPPILATWVGSPSPSIFGTALHKIQSGTFTASVSATA